MGVDAVPSGPASSLGHVCDPTPAKIKSPAPQTAWASPAVLTGYDQISDVISKPHFQMEALPFCSSVACDFLDEQS
ncbi:MAG: hypothetical protein KBB83_08485 [Alphaproteobacteria bacterium]|nr:hypothetical protein [Alphaproteobacteria bacterium]